MSISIGSSPGYHLSGGGSSSWQDALAVEFGNSAANYVLSNNGIFYKNYEVDFTALTPADWSGDSSGVWTSRTLDGKSIECYQSGNPSTWGITSNGLSFVGTSADTGQIRYALSSLLGTYNPQYSRPIMMMKFACATIAQGAYVQAYWKDEGVTNKFIGARLVHTSGNAYWYRNVNGSAGSDGNIGAQAVDYQLQMDLVQDTVVYSGEATAAALAAPDTLTQVNAIKLNATAGITFNANSLLAMGFFNNTSTSTLYIKGFALYTAIRKMP